MLVLGSASTAATAAIPREHALAIGVPLAALLGLATIGSPGIFIALLADVAPTGLLAATMVTGVTFILGAAVVLPPAFGALVDISESYRLACIALAVLLLVNVPVMLSIARLKPTTREQLSETAEPERDAGLR